MDSVDGDFKVPLINPMGLNDGFININPTLQIVKSNNASAEQDTFCRAIIPIFDQ